MTEMRYPNHGADSNGWEEEFDDLKVCVDCAYTVNGIDLDYKPEFQVCDEWWYYQFAFTYYTNAPEGYDEPVYEEFSSSQCAVCHTTMAGTRHIMSAWLLPNAKERWLEGMKQEWADRENDDRAIGLS